MRNVRLESDIIDNWRMEVDSDEKRQFSEFKRILKYRHWIAHGRYWVHESTVDFFEALVITTEALEVVSSY